MILVKCTSYKHTDDKGNPCILLIGELIRPIKTGATDGTDVEYEVVIWTNNTKELLPNCPSPDKQLGLVPYPHGTAPSLIAPKRDIFGVLGGPLCFFFRIYDTQVDVSEMIGKIYSIKVVDSDEK
jgi:hypothetical protein